MQPRKQTDPERSTHGRRSGGRWLIGLTALLLVACGGTSGPGAGTSTSPSQTGQPSATTSSPGPSSAPSPSSSAAPSPSSSASGRCASTSTWRTSGRTIDAAISPGSIGSIQVGQHPCYDRVVLSLSSTAEVGVAARYVPVVHADPSDRPLPVPGGAVIQLTVQARSTSTGGTGAGSIPSAVGGYVYSARALAGWPTLRAIRLAGEFEAVSTFAIGVRATLPFRVLTYADPATHRRLVIIDVADS